MATRRRHSVFNATPRPLVEDWTWQQRGSCRNMPTELFFPEDGARRHRSATEQRAKRVCRDCPVVAECREHAFAIGEPFGIWGATSALDRARLIASVPQRGATAGPRNPAPRRPGSTAV
jgi:WhiB family transcriptional regulator, redox-sensing transcriptional regulator